MRVEFFFLKTHVGSSKPPFPEGVLGRTHSLEGRGFVTWVVQNPCLERHADPRNPRGMSTPGDRVPRYPGFGYARLRRGHVGTRAASYVWS